MRAVGTLCLALSLVAVAAAPASAQKHISLMAGGGALHFDLAGTGTTPAFLGRVSDELGANLVLEGSLFYARPEQRLGRSTFLAPEVQLQYHVPMGLFTPYVCAGVGAARDSAGGTASDWRPTVSFAVGSRASRNDRVGLFGELRVRGGRREFPGTTIDITGGLVVRLGR